MDFLNVQVIEKTSNNRSEDYVVNPDFIFGGVEDIVCKGGEMYAFWYEGKWRTTKDELIAAVDKEILAKKNQLKEKYPHMRIKSRPMRLNSSGVMQEFDDYVKRSQQSDVQFNRRILFADDKVKKKDYATAQLDYTPEEGPTPAFEEMFDKLYREEELDKILWFIGALLTNSMTKIQKFLYLYGGKGSGKGTALMIFKKLLQGYYEPINLQQLTSNSEFATGQIKEIPLLIDEDSDMSKIKDDTNLLKMTAHEPVTVNKKYKHVYNITFEGLLITASNQRYKVRNIDSGITRRAVVAEPTGDTHSSSDYHRLMGRIDYELPQIAWKAMKLFEERGPFYYEDYVDISMMVATDPMFEFIRDNFSAMGDPTTLNRASQLYKIHLEELEWDTAGYKRRIKQELERYYRKFDETKRIDGVVTKNVYSDFRYEDVFGDKVESQIELPKSTEELLEELDIREQDSKFDEIAKDYPAQLAIQGTGTPKQKWDDVVTTLDDIPTDRLHFVRIPLSHIVIDFDKKNINGEKDIDYNLRAAQKFPPTYMELSKSGQGVHLHYIYDGDVTKLASLYEEDVEIKIFTGKSSLRRKLTKNNALDISKITTGLPEKKEEGVTVYKDVQIIAWNEKKMRTAIKGNLQLKYHDNTKPSMDFIAHIFEEAEQSGVKYDLRDMRQDILAFAATSTNQAATCMKIANKINYTTIDNEKDAKVFQEDVSIVKEDDIYFYDVEVYPNLFVIAEKRRGEPDEDTRVYLNPGPEKVEELMTKALVGFNNRRYDNHIMYARLLGEDNLSLYRQSQRIINKQGGSGMYGGAYELSYADIYEYSSKKQSLAKWQVELGIHHDEMELPWDQPVPEELWERVGEYCKNDVISTEAVFEETIDDYNARLILTSLSGLKVNATTTQHAAAFLFGDEWNPQDKFVYTDLSKDFPGYEYNYGTSTYKGEETGEGGYVYAEPGIYSDVVEMDVASMHPWSLINMNYFGEYTERFKNLVETRIYVKRGEFDKAREMFDGQLVPYLEDETTANRLGYALKLIINIVYGMTSAKFDNKFKHPKNIDNIVAKRGALFMVDLKLAVQEKGYTVVHIKTDSIKIAGADDDILKFIVDYGKEWGYDFSVDNKFDKMALVNKAVLIGKSGDEWTTIGAQFSEPYVYKRLLSKEDIEETDYAIVKQTTKPIFLGETFVGRVANVYASLTGEEMKRIDEEQDKVSYVAGTKGHKWRLFTDYQGKDDVDILYYEDLVDKAIDALNRVGNAEDIIELPETVKK